MPIERSAGGGGGSSTGVQLDYVQITSNVSITATTDATAQAVITGNAVTYSGSQRIKIEFECVGFQVPITGEIILNLYDGAADQGRLIVGSNPGTAGTNQDISGGYAAQFVTPTAGAHTYSIRAWKIVGTPLVYAGAGGAATILPAWYRITTA